MSIYRQIFFIVIGLLLADTSMAQHTYGSYYTNDALVNFILAENKTDSAAIVMVPGLTYHHTYILQHLMAGKDGLNYLQIKGMMYI